MHDRKQNEEDRACSVAVLWIDWYPYHVARFLGLLSVPSLAGAVQGIEMVGGVGVHAGLKFRQSIPQGVPITTLLPATNWANANKWVLARLVWAKLTELQPATVLVPGYYTLPAIAAAIWARLHGRTSVLMTESAEYDHVRSGWKEWGKRLLLKALFGWAIAGGKDHRAYLARLGFRQDRVARFYDVVDNAFFADGAAALRQHSSAQQHGLPLTYFLYVGRLAAEKNVRGLFAAWLAYRAANGTWSLVFAGDGPERRELERLAAESNLRDQVRITGLCSAEQLLPLYAFASTFVLASTREPWGLVVNEAMAAGLPVIVTDRCGCANDLVTGAGTGIVVPAGNGLALTQAMLEMEQHSPAARMEMGRAAQERVRPYSPHRFGVEVAVIVNAGAADLAPRQAVRQSQ